eukprot:g6585.t1
MWIGSLWILLLTITSTSATSPLASETLLWGNGLTEVHAGETASFYLQTRDSAGDNTTIAATEISVSCVSVPEAPYDFCEEDPIVEDLGLGLFRVHFTVGRFWADDLDPALEGIFPSPLPINFFSHTNDRLHVKVANNHVIGSPFYPLFIGSSIMDPKKSMITATTTEFIAGVSAAVGGLHKIRDRFGNNIRPAVLDVLQSNCTLTKTFVGGNTNITSPATVDSSWVLGNWYVKFTITCFVAGNYIFEASANTTGGSEVNKFPIESSINGVVDTDWHLTCKPNKIAYMSFDIPDLMLVGKGIVISVQAFDKFGNAAYFAGDQSNLFGLSIESQQINESLALLFHESCNCSLINSLVYQLDEEVPGRLQVQFKTTKSGLHLFRFYYQDVEFTIESIALNVQPEVPDPSQSKAFLRTEGDFEGELSMSAGDQIKLHLRLRDLYSNPSSGEKINLSARLIDVMDPADYVVNLEIIEEEESDPEGHYYHFMLQSTRAGTYDLLVAYKGQVFFDSPWSVSIAASQTVDPLKSIIAGSAIGIEIGMEKYYISENYRQIAGRNMSLIVSAVDIYGNLQTTTKPNFELNQELQQVSKWVERVQLGDGKTKFYFAIESVGIYYVQVSYHGVQVYQSNLEVGPAGVLHLNCRVFNLQTTIAGELGRAYLQVKDTYGNLYNNKYKHLIDLDQFFVGFQPTNQASSQEIIYVNFGEFDKEQEAVEFTFNLTRSGVYTLSARWESWPVQGHESSLTILPAAVSPYESHFLLNSSAINAEEQLVLMVEFHDHYNNLIVETNSLIELINVRVEGPDGQEMHNTSTGVMVESEGVLKAGVRITSQGEYTVQVFLEDDCVVPCVGRNFVVYPADFSNTTSKVEFTRKVAIGVWNEVLFFPRDKFSNSLHSRAFSDKLLLDITGEGVVETKQFQEADVFGQLRAHYKVNQTGTYQLAILQNSATIYLSSEMITASGFDDQREAESSRNWLIDNLAVLGLMGAGCLLLLAVGYWFCIREEPAIESEADVQIHQEQKYDIFMQPYIDNKYEDDVNLANEKDRIKAYRV